MGSTLESDHHAGLMHRQLLIQLILAEYMSHVATPLQTFFGLDTMGMCATQPGTIVMAPYYIGDLGMRNIIGQCIVTLLLH